MGLLFFIPLYGCPALVQSAMWPGEARRAGMT
jgi:hypothetical protein